MAEPHEHHTHDHSHEPQVESMDAAQRSLSDALKVSFSLLKVAMIFLLVAYCLSGIFGVEENERAVRLQFGGIVGDDEGGRVYGPGLHFGLPFPIGDHINIDIRPQTMSINKAFWYETQGNAATAEERAAMARPLDPMKDGSLLTGDANVVHARFEVVYVISERNLVDYVTNIGSKALAEQVVRTAAEHGVVHAIAKLPADELIAGRFDREAARRETQSVLDAMEAGIDISSFTAGQTTMPLTVVGAYQAVSNAESEKSQMIEAARKDYSRILSEAAGQAREDLYELVREYEQAAALNDREELAELDKAFEAAFDDEAGQTLRMPTDRGGKVIGGETARIINEANTYRTQTVETVKADAQTFKLLYEQYKANPRILLTRLLEDAREQVFTGDVETIYAPTGNLYIETNRDPDVQRQREEQKLLEAEQRRRQQQSGR